MRVLTSVSSINSSIRPSPCWRQRTRIQARKLSLNGFCTNVEGAAADFVTVAGPKFDFSNSLASPLNAKSPWKNVFQMAILFLRPGRKPTCNSLAPPLNAKQPWKNVFKVAIQEVCTSMRLACVRGTVCFGDIGNLPIGIRLSCFCGQRRQSMPFTKI